MIGGTLVLSTLLLMRASREYSGGRLGSNLKLGDNCSSRIRWINSEVLGGDADGEAGGGADIDLRDFRRGAILFRASFGLVGDGLTGDEDSAPDWKILLSSHPLSSAA